MGGVSITNLTTPFLSEERSMPLPIQDGYEIINDTCDDKNE